MRLGDVVSLKRGKTYKSSLLGDQGIPLLGLATIDKEGGFRAGNFKCYSGDAEESLLVSAGEIYASLKDVTQNAHLLGSVARLPPEVKTGRLTQDTVALKIAPGAADPSFLYWVLRAPQTRTYFKSFATGTTNLGLSREDFLSLPLPAATEPRLAISSILDNIEELIRVNRKTNETLEAMAKALFKSWFVDFDPVRAKAEGRPTGLPADISDLFPDSFEDSELGGIPSGWEIKGLDEVADFLNGLALQKYPPEEGIPRLPVIKIAQLKKGDSAGADQCSSSLPGEYVVRDGDVLFSWSGSLAVDIWCGGDGALNQHLFKVTSKSHSKWFFYHWVKHHLPDFQEIAKSKATTMGHIQRHHLSAAKAVIPAPSLLGSMDSVFEPLLERSFGLRSQSRELSAIRDSLLPKLISGELRIPDAEKLLEEVAV